MKKLSILLVGISSSLLLCGCNHNNSNSNNNGDPKEISEKQFAEKLSKVEAHEYKGATIHATENIVGTGDFTQNRHEERTEEYTYFPDTEAWIVEHGDSILRKYIYCFDSLGAFKGWIEDVELSYSYKYYSDLTVEIKEDGTFTEEMMGVVRTVTIDSSMTIKINEYGYLVSLEGTYEQDIVQTASGTTYSGTKSGESSISVTYK